VERESAENEENVGRNFLANGLYRYSAQPTASFRAIIPAKAGIHVFPGASREPDWTSFFNGVTMEQQISAFAGRILDFRLHGNDAG